MTRQIICGLERWNFVGNVTRESDQIVIRDCYNIRRWGTTEGLGQLAIHGPQVDTVLDHYGIVKLHVMAVAASIDCDDSAWEKHDREHSKRVSKRGAK